MIKNNFILSVKKKKKERNFESYLYILVSSHPVFYSSFYL